MRTWLVIVHIALVGSNLWATAHFHEEMPEDNEFAEFEDFDDERPKKEAHIEQFTTIDEDDEFEEEEEEVSIEDEIDAEFAHFRDEEEFEGLDGNSKNSEKSDEPSTLTITKVPLNLRSRWDAFYLEILMVAGLIVYFINYIAGRAKNSGIAETWLEENGQLLRDNFSLVGDVGKGIDEVNETGLIKQSESRYSIYCSGRVGCDSMLVELELIQRQDLVAVLAQLIRPQNDRAVIKIEISKDESDNFVLAIASKKTASYLSKDVADITMYCPERRQAEKFGLPVGFFVMSEVAEAASGILDTRVLHIFNKYSQYIDYIHISDQYSGLKQQEDSGALTMPEVKRILYIGLNITVRGKIPSSEREEIMRSLLQFTFHILDKLRRFKLSKEGRSKTDKNRLRVEEAFLKTTHAARAEAAAQKREDKRRAEKERILQEEDPDKQRKWEEKEQKRLAKKRAPRMKQLKVKAL